MSKPLISRLQVTSAAYSNFSSLAGLPFFTSIFSVPVSLITIPSYMISGRGWMLPQHHTPRKVVYTK